jgi:hypothetical protein
MSVSWGELAGHKKGITTWRGDSYLITKGPIIIKPNEGEFSTIRGILDDLFGEEQLEYFHAWLKTSYEVLRDGEMSTGQVLVLAGPAGIGKSFIKEFIIRPILGGRHTDPTSYLQGKTHFNADTAKAESWEIDDSVGISDSHKRKMYTAAFKKLAASNDHRIEAKGKDGIQPPPVFHRLSVYTNDDAYDLWVLPAMSDSLVDKAVILKAHRAEKPSISLPAVNERAAFREKIAKELPAFVYWLTQWVIPEDLTNGRYGVKAYQHEELAEKLDQMSDEARLLEMIDILIFDATDDYRDKPVDIRSSRLEILLREQARFVNMTRELEKVLWNRQALANGLGNLKGHGRVEKKKKDSKGNRGWIIYPPSFTKNDIENWKTKRAEENLKAKEAFETPEVKEALEAMEAQEALEKETAEAKFRAKEAKKKQKALEAEEAKKNREVSDILEKPGVRETLNELKPPGALGIRGVLTAPGVREALQSEMH